MTRWRRGLTSTWLTSTWLACLAVLCGALVALTYLLAVQTTEGRLLDGSSLRGAHARRSSLTARVEELLNLVSVASLVGAVAVVAMIALIRLRRVLALAAVVVIVGSTITTQVLKRFVLHRPSFGFYETTPATLNSLPSGHSTVAFSVAVALVMVIPTRLRSQTALLGLGFAVVVALATLSAGWHRPSDAVAAFLVVGGWVFLAAAVLVARSTGAEPTEGDPGARPVTARRLMRSATAVIGLAALLAAVVVTSQIDDYGTAAQLLAYSAGLAAIAGTGGAVMGLLLAMMPVIVPQEAPRTHNAGAQDSSSPGR